MNDATVYQLWQHSLQMGICIRIFRDEVSFSTNLLRLSIGFCDPPRINPVL